MTLLERLNTEDHFAQHIGARLVEIGEGYARAELTVEAHHINGAGVCQGGVLFTLADLAFAGVANGHHLLTLGLSNTITFLQAAQLGDRLTATCTEVLDHKRLPYCDIRICRADGTLLAVMTGLAYRLKKEIAYQQLM